MVLLSLVIMLILFNAEHDEIKVQIDNPVMMETFLTRIRAMLIAIVVVTKGQTIVSASGDGANSDSLTIRMPNARPMKRDTYFCTSLQLPHTTTNGEQSVSEC